MIDRMIGFIGAGNMGRAMIGGICKSELVTTSQVIASAHTVKTLEDIKHTYAIETTLSNTRVAEQSDILFLAVKPNKFDEVISEIASYIKHSCIIVSIAAGKSISSIEAAFGKDIKLVRTMPNTPALVGEAMRGWSAVTISGRKTGQKALRQTAMKAMSRQLPVQAECFFVPHGCCSSGRKVAGNQLFLQ